MSYRQCIGLISFAPVFGSEALVTDGAYHRLELVSHQYLRQGILDLVDDETVRWEFQFLCRGVTSEATWFGQVYMALLPNHLTDSHWFHAVRQYLPIFEPGKPVPTPPPAGYVFGGFSDDVGHDDKGVPLPLPPPPRLPFDPVTGDNLLHVVYKTSKLSAATWQGLTFRAYSRW